MSYHYATDGDPNNQKSALELIVNPRNRSYPGKMFPIRGNMIFKIKRESLEEGVNECTFFQKEPNFYRENFSEAYMYNTKYVIDSTDYIRIYGMPLGFYLI